MEDYQDDEKFIFADFLEADQHLKVSVIPFAHTNLCSVCYRGKRSTEPYRATDDRKA